ncbi:MAG: hypothetical protein KOO63_14930 [Bacteroidales bacterium]|nr:hypothetical protein [Candidatus Latescibacterota bacterium]
MKRMISALAVMFLIPGMLMACPTLGVYYGGRLHYDPVGPFTEFELNLYIVHQEHFVTAVEYQLLTPSDLTHALFMILSVSYPPNQSLSLGTPFGGHSITFWPPCSGYPDGYDQLATYTCMTTVPCEQMYDYPLAIGSHPDSGELRGTFYPDNEMFEITGLTTYLCLHEVSVAGDSWGVIKSLYKE